MRGIKSTRMSTQFGSFRETIKRFSLRRDREERMHKLSGRNKTLRMKMITNIYFQSVINSILMEIIR